MNIYDQLKQLWARVTDLTKNGAAADTKIATLEAAAVRIPKDYSITETDTGLKWIDGKEIYSLTIEATIPVLTQTASVDIIENLSIDTLVYLSTRIITSTGNTNSFIASNYSKTGGKITCLNVSSGYSEGLCICVVNYTKPDATREPDDEPETKATKAAKKKASK